MDGQTKDLLRILAPNPSPLTGPGTTTFLLGQEETAVIDPGPDDHVWFAGPATEARRARQFLTVFGVNKRQFTAAAYWGQPDSRA